MDFWEQQAILESEDSVRSAHNYTLNSISKIQHSIVDCIVYSIRGVRINFTKPDYKEVYSHLLHSRSNTLLISIDEIPEKMSSDSEQRLYNTIQKHINNFNASNRYLNIQGSSGTYTIKANSDFYNIFNSDAVKRESVNDFFEEEVIRLNESFVSKVINAIKSRFGVDPDVAFKEFADWYADTNNKKRFRNFINSSIVKKTFKFIDNINGYKTCWHDLRDINNFGVCRGNACTVLTEIPNNKENVFKIKEFINDNNIEPKNMSKNHFKITMLINEEKNLVIYMDIDYKNI